MKKSIYRVEVEWEDSTMMHGGWEDIDDFLKRRKAVRCFSVGLVLVDDDKGVVLAASVHGKQAAGVTIIPRSQIVRSRRLK